jgi:hypothetical protein
VLFFLVSAFFVYRSFYGMRIHTHDSDAWRAQVSAASAAADS